MLKSESIVNLSKALLKFQSMIGNISKDASNPFHKNKYASLTNILDGINDSLLKCGLVVMQHPSGDGESIKLHTMIIHAESGENMSSEFAMIPVKRDPQGIGSCITYMRRYALASILKLNVDDDDDGNAASQKQAVKQNKSASTESIDSILAHIFHAQTIDELKQIGKDIASFEKTDAQRDELRKHYNARMEYIKGGEGM